MFSYYRMCSLYHRIVLAGQDAFRTWTSAFGAAASEQGWETEEEVVVEEGS